MTNTKKGIKTRLNSSTIDKIDDFKNNRTKYWLTRKLDIIEISDMTDNHIQNCIDLIESKNGWRKEYLIPLKKELAKRKGKIGNLVYGD